VIRRLDEAREAIVAEGRFGPFLAGYLEHVRRWEQPVDGLGLAMIRQGLAAAALHIASRPTDESVGLTLNFAEPPTNVFLGADAATSSVTGRVYTRAVKTAETGRLFVQTYRLKTGVTESVIPIEGLDVLDVFEQYFRLSVQTPARFLEPDEDRFVMVLGMPGVDPEWVAGLGDADLTPARLNALRLLDERPVSFHCSCTRERMLDAVRNMFATRPEELFAGEDRVETSCPRCGQRWWVTRVDFEGREAGPD